jgi:hypothetical protein
MIKKIKTISMLLLTMSIANANSCNDDVLKLLKGRNDIIISVKHYTYNWDYVLCADFKRETEPSDLSCDFELDSSDDKEFMEFKASQIKKQLKD